MNSGASLDAPAITTWGRGNYSVRGDRYRFTRYFDGGEELYDHQSDPDEWKNLADSTEHAEIKAKLAASLPSQEAPLVREGVALWNVIDADRPERLDKFKKDAWPNWVEKLRPHLE